ncbi:MAG: phage tail protein [Clostridia bacterium]|nr:phage tail protein [Clostridia bacterium]
MYIVNIYNNGISTEIHGHEQKLASGNVVKGINSIDTFSFALLPSNKGFNNLYEYKTLVEVFNTNKNRFEFQGRVLCSNPAMSESGEITKSVTCESFFGFLCDSKQVYVAEQNWTVTGLLQHIIDTHNSQMEEYKHFVIGEVTVTDPNDNLYCGIQRENTWDTIKKKLIDVLGGEIRFRVVDGVIYIDYLTQIGETKSTPIALSRNMKSISKEKDPSAYITRLIPLGCKLQREETTVDAEGNEQTQLVETEERLDISSVNDGKNYIDDEQAIEKYGLIVGYVEWDDVTEALNLKTKGENWLAENNKVQVKYSITNLDLSLLGLDIDDFEVHNYHPIINALLGIDDTARIIKKNINVCEEVESTIEVGENFKTLSDLQIEQTGKIDTATQTIAKIESDYVTNEKLSSENFLINSLIKQTADSILSSVSETYVNKTDDEEYRKTVEAQLKILSDEILLKFTTTTEQIIGVDDDLQTKFTELYQYISFAGGSIKLGASDSAITLTIENDVINFKRNGVIFGYWDGENFYTGNIIIRLGERFQLGNFAFLPRTDNSVMVLKVGE